MKKTIIVVGAGKGLGNHIAKKFGQNNFQVVLMARSEASLKQYEAEFVAEGVDVYTQPVDVSKIESLTAGLANAKAKFGTPDVLIYNVGITNIDQPGTIDSDELIRHYQVDVASAYHCVQQVVSDEFGQKNGAIIFTGGGLALYPHPQFIPLSMDKAALRALAFLLNQDLAPKGIFVGTVTIAGSIAPETHFSPELIAETYWDLYRERKECEVVYQ